MATSMRRCISSIVHSGFADGRPGDGHAIGRLGFLIILERLHELGPEAARLDWSEAGAAA